MARMVKHEKNAPYEVPEGTELPVWICGCGLSKNKPFCDGTHTRIGFQAAEAAVRAQQEQQAGKPVETNPPSGDPAKR